MEKKQILVVEDERIIAEVIRKNLLGLGYEVPAVVSTGEKSIEKVEELSPDLVLMDIMLKGEMDGIEAAEKICSSFNIPVVYLTAYSDQKILGRAKITEPYGYILKPFRERELQINIEIALYRHEMEKKIKESRKWFSTTLQSIGDAVIATDSNGNIIFMNPSAQSLTGWTFKEASGKQLNEVYNIINEDSVYKTDNIINDDSADKTDNTIIRAVEEGVIIGQAKTLLIARDEKRIPVEDSGDPIRDDKGNIIGSVYVFRDITERMQAEEELVTVKELYEEILEDFIIGVWVTDKKDIICYANKGMIAITGAKPENIIGLDIPKDFPEIFKSYYLNARETLQPVHYSAIKFISPEKTIGYYSGWLIPRIKNGIYNGIICTVESIPKKINDLDTK